MDEFEIVGPPGNSERKIDMQTTKALDDTQAIAEEGFIYGLPIVMNYAVMYEYSVDRNSGQFKAPFNQIKVFRSSTQFSAVAYRTQLFNPEDMPNVVKIQAGYKVQPLSQYLKQPAPPAAPDVNSNKHLGVHVAYEDAEASAHSSALN